MTIIVEGYCILIIVITIDTRESYDRPAKVAANVFGNCFRIGKIWLGIDIESIFLIFVRKGFVLFELSFFNWIGYDRLFFLP